MELRRTPLYEAHRRLAARLIDFGGWEMPVQYSGIVDEHLCVRKSGGIFDISHMGEISVSGPGALAFLNRLLTNDASRLSVGLGQYTLMCNERGGTIDDLYLYSTGENRYLLIVNASRIEADWAWIQAQHAAFADPASVKLDNWSDLMSAVAVQGPGVAAVMDECFDQPASGGGNVSAPSQLLKNQIAKFVFGGDEVWIGRTGYTGEDGFEIVSPNSVIRLIWDTVLAKGHAASLQPCGLGARDTLRTEMGYPLYGHELSESITPIEAGLAYFCALEKPDFNGRTVLAAQKASGPRRKAIAFTMAGKSAPPRAHYPVCLPGETGAVVGEVTSGTQSPSLNCGIGLALVEAEHAVAGGSIAIEIRGRRYSATIVKKPIYRRVTS